MNTGLSKTVAAARLDFGYALTFAKASNVELYLILYGTGTYLFVGSTRLGPLYTEMEQQRQRREQQVGRTRGDH